MLDSVTLLEPLGGIDAEVESGFAATERPADSGVVAGLEAGLVDGSLDRSVDGLVDGSADELVDGFAAGLTGPAFTSGCGTLTAVALL